MFEWLAPKPVTVAASLRAVVGGHPLIAETLVRRGITTAEAARAFMNPGAVIPAAPWEFPDMERAVDRINTAVQARERICVWGDFDVDGQTSTTLLVSTLRHLGANVTHYIPHRETESHGVNPAQLARIIEEGTQLLLTCDTGIDAYDAVDYATKHGVSVIITDHHELPSGSLPPAYAIINPHLLSENHALAALPGVGVAFKLAEALYERAGRPETALRHLDLVALGIVADVAQLAGDTRYLLQIGLPVLRETPRLGLHEMFKLAQVLPAQVNEETISFVLAPRLNALGRLDDANVIVDFFTTQDQVYARALAERLETLNNLRRRLSMEVEQAAEAQLQDDPKLLAYAALVLSHPQWPTGVVGIVANRLAERYNRPTILLVAPESGLVRGSARSIPGCNIIEAIATQSALLEHFGGHAQAAGVALTPDNIPAFRSGLSRAIEAQCGTVAPAPTLQIDGILPFSDLSLGLVDEIERLAPFGAGNPPLTLATRNVKAKEVNLIGRDGDHLAVNVEDGSGTTQRVIWWRARQSDVPGDAFDLAYTVRANTFRGERRLQVEWLAARPTQEDAPHVLVEIPRRVIEDYRREPHPQLLLDAWQQRLGAQVWAEAMSVKGARTRLHLEPGPILILWTTPPGPSELASALSLVNPTEIALFAIRPEVDTFDTFTYRLAGLVHYALNHKQGQVSLSALAAAMAHRETTVRCGLMWLKARGILNIPSVDGDTVVVERGGTEDQRASERLGRDLQALLEETAAYRRFFAQSSVEVLL